MVKVKFKDVAHHYLGCKLVHRWSSPNESEPIVLDTNRLKLGVDDWIPILKPFSDVSEFDAEILGWADLEGIKETHRNDSYLDEFNSIEFSYLLSQHVDLFNLLENGEAIKPFNDIIYTDNPLGKSYCKHPGCKKKSSCGDFCFQHCKCPKDE